MSAFLELSDILIKTFDLPDDIFEIETEGLPIFDQDYYITTYSNVALKNKYFKSYHYRVHLDQHWKSIVLNINRVYLDAIINFVNEFLIDLDKENIDTIELEAKRNSLNGYKYDCQDNGLGFLVVFINLEEAYIDVAKSIK